MSYYLLMNSAIERITRNDMPAHRCPDCGRWAYDGERIRHSSRCDIPEAQAKLEPEASVSVPSVRESAKRGDSRAHGFSTDDLVLAVRNGEISESDAMNQDM